MVDHISLPTIDFDTRSSVSCHIQYTILVQWISNSNWTEWSTVQGVIAQVISKSDKRNAQGRFKITSMITP